MPATKFKRGDKVRYIEGERTGFSKAAVWDSMTEDGKARITIKVHEGVRYLTVYPEDLERDDHERNPGIGSTAPRIGKMSDGR